MTRAGVHWFFIVLTSVHIPDTATELAANFQFLNSRLSQSNQLILQLILTEDLFQVLYWWKSYNPLNWRQVFFITFLTILCCLDDFIVFEAHFKNRATSQMFISQSICWGHLYTLIAAWDYYLCLCRINQHILQDKPYLAWICLPCGMWFRFLDVAWWLSDGWLAAASACHPVTTRSK